MLELFDVKVIDNCSSECVASLQIESSIEQVCSNALDAATLGDCDEYFVARYENRWVMRCRYAMHSVVIERV